MLHSIHLHCWKTQQWPHDWKRSIFIPIPKKGKSKECSNHCTITLISHACKLMLKILQARLQQYMNQELPDVQARFRKRRGTRDQISHSHRVIGKARQFHKNICFIDHTKLFDCVDHNELLEILKGIAITENLTCLLKNLYAGQEAAVRTRHGTMDWLKIGKRVHQVCILSLCMFNYKQSASWEMPDWIRHKLKWRFLGEIAITSYM